MHEYVKALSAGHTVTMHGFTEEAAGNCLPQKTLMDLVQVLGELFQRSEATEQSKKRDEQGIAYILLCLPCSSHSVQKVERSFLYRSSVS